MAENENQNENQNQNQNQNNSNESQQKSTEIRLTQEQFEQLIQSNNINNNNNNNNNSHNKNNIFVRGYNKTKDSLDTNTRGMDGSVLSIGRWIISFVKEMIDGLREYMRMRQVEKKHKKEDD